jgi:hypothetical protein
MIHNNFDFHTQNSSRLDKSLNKLYCKKNRGWKTTGYNRLKAYVTSGLRLENHRIQQAESLCYKWPVVGKPQGTTG